MSNPIGSIGFIFALAVKISAGIANLEDTLENAEQEKKEGLKEVSLIWKRLRELKLIADTTLSNRLHRVHYLSTQGNVQGLAGLRKELDKALKKHHQNKEDKND